MQGLQTLFTWTILGASAGMLTARMLFMMWNGVGNILPLAVLWGIVGWLAGGPIGLGCGIALACCIGLFVGR